jgi:hypothetical protein
VKRVVLGTVDQALVGACLAALLVGVAHTADVAEFARFSFALLVLTVAVSTCRGLFGLPLALKADQPRAVLDLEARHALSATLALGAALGGPLALAFLLTGADPALVLLSCAAPAALAQDSLRFAAAAMGRTTRACVSDAVWTVVTVVATALAWSGRATSAVAVVAIWLTGCVVALAVLVRGLRVRPVRRSGAWFRGDLEARWRFGLDALVGSVATLVVLAAAGVVVGAAAVAALRGAAVVFGVVMIAVQAIPLVVVPELRRRNLDDTGGLWRYTLRLGIPVSGLSVLLGLVAAALPESAGRLVLGETWSQVRVILPVTGVEYALLVWLNAANGVLRARAQARYLVRTRLVFATSSLVLGVGAGVLFHTALAIAVGLAVAAGLSASWATHLTGRRTAASPREHEAVHPSHHAGREDPVSVADKDVEDRSRPVLEPVLDEAPLELDLRPEERGGTPSVQESLV